MKYLIFCCIIGGFFFSSCSSDNFDLSEIDPHSIDTTYVGPFYASPSLVAINYLDQNRIDTLSLFGMYCDQNSDFNFFLSNRNTYLPSTDPSFYDEDSNFISVDWQNETILDTTVEDLSFYSNILDNGQLLNLSSNGNSGKCDYGISLSEGFDLNTAGEIEVDVYDTSDGSFYSQVSIRFEYNDLTKVLCN